MNCKT
jgi:4-carboxymuconolactone decarboxylase